MAFKRNRLRVSIGVSNRRYRNASLARLLAASFSTRDTSAKRILPTPSWIVEGHSGGIKHLLVELSAGPGDLLLVLLMVRIGNRRQEVRVSVNAVAVLGRTTSLSRDASRIGQRVARPLR